MDPIVQNSLSRMSGQHLPSLSGSEENQLLNNVSVSSQSSDSSQSSPLPSPSLLANGSKSSCSLLSDGSRQLDSRLIDSSSVSEQSVSKEAPGAVQSSSSEVVHPLPSLQPENQISLDDSGLVITIDDDEGGDGFDLSLIHI